MKFQLLGYLLLAAVTFSCTSGKKAFEEGDYYTAVLQAVDRLRKNPDHKKSRETLKKAYPLAIKYYESQIRNLQLSEDRFVSGRMYDTYMKLNNLNDEINRSPGALRVIPNPKSYYQELSQYREMAAEERYQAGMEALELNTRESAKEAHYHFQQANSYVPNYKDVNDKMEEAMWMATLKVIVEQVPTPTLQYQISVNFFQEKIEEFLFHFDGNQFVRFFPSTTDIVKQPDHILVVAFEDFSVGNTNNFQHSQEISRDSVVVGTVTMDDGTKRDVLGTVKATYTEFKREVISNGIVTMRILDGFSEQVIVHEKFPGEFVWTSYWGNFKGDERALTSEQIAICNNEPAMPPPPQQLFVEFTKPIYQQITGHIRNYYRQY